MSDTISGQRAAGSASGRFVLRVDPELHGALREEAKARAMSLNALCAEKLATPSLLTGGPAEMAVRQASRVLGESLVGVVVFGSWARREMGEASDVDLLIVVEDWQQVDRGLYRSWDESPATWDGHRMEPHFVHLPGPGDRLTGLWAEVAVEGVVLFDKDFRVSARLVEFRKDIAAGRVIRRRMHGQSYWVEVA